MRALDTATTGMQARVIAIDTIAHNIANINNTGFKRQAVEFADLLYQTKLGVGNTSNVEGDIIPAGVEIGLGVKTVGLYRIQEQGQLVETNNPYDIAIDGNGFFRIEVADAPDGFAYTRAGSFQLSPQREIVTLKGEIVSPGIIVPDGVAANQVSINEDGQVYALVQGNLTPTLLGQIVLVNFPNPVGLRAIGNNLLITNPASGDPIVGIAKVDGMGRLIQNWKEASNVDPVVELTTMITEQRGYELCSKVIKVGDEMLQTINNIK